VAATRAECSALAKRLAQRGTTLSQARKRIRVNDDDDDDDDDDEVGSAALFDAIKVCFSNICCILLWFERKFSIVFKKKVAIFPNFENRHRCWMNL
jgi:hypothetical protein